MSNYFTAPIEGAVLEGRFTVGAEPIDALASHELAERINQVVTAMGGQAVWFSERDKQEARILGTPVKIGGKVVHYTTIGSELAIFPGPSNL